MSAIAIADAGSAVCSSVLLRVSKLSQAGLVTFWAAARVDSRSPLARMTADSRLAYAGLYRMGWYSLTLPWGASSLSSIVVGVPFRGTGI